MSYRQDYLITLSNNITYKCSSEYTGTGIPNAHLKKIIVDENSKCYQQPLNNFYYKAKKKKKHWYIPQGGSTYYRY